MSRILDSLNPAAVGCFMLETSVITGTFSIERT